MNVIEHKHCIIRAETKFSPSEAELREWILVLVHKLGMKVLAGPISGDITDVPGNNGPTCVVVIETSHMSAHIWTDPEDHDLWQIDVYTCGALDRQIILNHLQKYIPIKVDVRVFDREYNLEEIT